MSFVPLMPPALDKGSSGNAVLNLQELLFMLGFAEEGLKTDDEYGDMTAASVKKLQTHLGVDPDGNFGPITRAALKALHGIDVDAIPWNNDYDTTTWFGAGADPDGSVWPPDVADDDDDKNGNEEPT